MSQFDMGGDPLTLGIDPGKQGALAFLDPDGGLRHIEDMPPHSGAGLGDAVRALLADMSPDYVAVAWVEQTQAFPGQGRTSAHDYGREAGAVLGALGALSVPVHMVHPSVWKKAVGLNRQKATSIDLAAGLWPGTDWFRRKKDDGRAEAALIARYGQAQP